MKIFSIILTFIGSLLLFLVIGGEVFIGAGALKFLFAFLLATVVVLVGWGFVDMMIPRKKPEE